MKKTFLLLFVLGFFVSSTQLSAQKRFMASFKNDFMAELYASFPDSLRPEISRIETPEKFLTFSKIKSLSQMEDIVSKRYASDFLIRYRSNDFLAVIRESKNLDDFCFDFFFVSEDDSLHCLQLLETSGNFHRVLSTKNGKKYEIDHAWGFLQIMENNLSLLNCYCSYKEGDDEKKELFVVPFEGTNSFVWGRLENGNYFPAFDY